VTYFRYSALYKCTYYYYYYFLWWSTTDTFSRQTDRQTGRVVTSATC